MSELVRAAADVLGHRPRQAAFDELRQRLRRGILLGLELLVAADIIDTAAREPVRIKPRGTSPSAR